MVCKLFTRAQHFKDQPANGSRPYRIWKMIIQLALKKYCFPDKNDHISNYPPRLLNIMMLLLIEILLSTKKKK